MRRDRGSVTYTPHKGWPSEIATKSGDSKIESAPGNDLSRRRRGESVRRSLVFAEAVRMRKREEERETSVRTEEREGEGQRNAEQEHDVELTHLRGRRRARGRRRTVRKPRPSKVAFSLVPHLQSIPTRAGPVREEAEKHVPHLA